MLPFFLMEQKKWPHKCKTPKKIGIEKMQKSEIRKEYIEKRKQLPDNLYFELSQKISDQFFFHFHAKLIHECTIHLFLPIEKNKEPNTNFILKILFQRFKKIKVVVPKTDFVNIELAHYQITDDSILQNNKYGIPEPVGEHLIAETEINLVLVPLLAFDTKGHRIGYGGGFYDRFLAKLSPECIKIGLSFFEPVSDFQKEITDIKLDFCITPHKIYSFSD